MSEDAPPLPSVDESQRVEDPEKARAMALVGHSERSRAARIRGDDPAFYGGEAYPGVTQLGEAEKWDVIASENEEEEGERYDAENGLLSQEEQAQFLEHMALLLREHPISAAYREAHISLGKDISTAEGLVALGSEAYRQAQEVDRIKFSNPKRAVELLEEAKGFMQILVDIESGRASDPNYQKPSPPPEVNT